jgi:hypothetical protein
MHRMLVSVGLSAIVLVGLGMTTNAQGQQEQGWQEDQKDAGQDRAWGPQQEPTMQEPTKQEQPRAEAERQDLIRQHELRLPQYREVLNQQEGVAEQRAAQLQEQKRNALYRYQREYLAHLVEQRSRLESRDRHEYARDPFFYTPSSYRYHWGGGRVSETNQYGLDLLRQAVSYGYEEGSRAGRADQDDRWPSNYKDCFAYQDANYGYGGFYVERDDYNYYFREGFRRGYEDGYERRHDYSSVSNGKIAILPAAVAEIIVYELIR